MSKRLIGLTHEATMVIKGLQGRSYSTMEPTKETLYEYIKKDGKTLREVVQPLPVLADEMFLCLSDEDGKLLYRWSGSEMAHEINGGL